jgi:hypothetical protein
MKHTPNIDGLSIFFFIAGLVIIFVMVIAGFFFFFVAGLYLAIASFSFAIGIEVSKRTLRFDNLIGVMIMAPLGLPLIAFGLLVIWSSKDLYRTIFGSVFVCAMIIMLSWFIIKMSMKNDRTITKSEKMK